MIIKGIGNIINEKMYEFGLERDALAKKLNISDKNLQRIIDFEDIKKLDVFVDLCTELDLSPGELLEPNIKSQYFTKVFGDIARKKVPTFIEFDFVYKAGYGKRVSLPFQIGEKDQIFSEIAGEVVNGLESIVPLSKDSQYRGIQLRKINQDFPHLNVQKGDYALVAEITEESKLKDLAFLGFIHSMDLYSLVVTKSGDSYVGKTLLGDILFPHKLGLLDKDHILIFKSERDRTDFIQRRFENHCPFLTLLEQELNSNITARPVLAFVRDKTARTKAPLLEEIERLKAQLAKTQGNKEKEG